MNVKPGMSMVGDIILGSPEPVDVMHSPNIGMGLVESNELSGMYGPFGLAGGAAIAYLLRDEFEPTDRAAGAVNGTLAEPGPGTRTVVDTGNDLSITAGTLDIAGGTSTVFDPRLTYEALTRQVGRFIKCRCTPLTSRGPDGIGFLDDVGLGDEPEAVVRFISGVLYAHWNAAPAANLEVGNYANSTSYDVIVLLRASGAYYFITGGAFSLWTLVWVSSISSTVTVYPGAVWYSGTSNLDYIRIPDVLWLPIPIAYDSFTRANGALGSSETSGPDAQAVPARVWNNRVGTTLVAGNAASASVLVGGIAIATVDTGTADVLCISPLTRVGGNIGIVVRYADTDNYVYAIHDGTNATLTKRVAGVETPVISAITAYAGGADIVVICDGTSFALYYGNARVGVTSTINDVGLQGGTEQGTYSSNIGNSQDDFNSMARGTGGEYAELDDF